MKVNGREINLNGMTLSKTEGARPNKKYEKANDQHVRRTVLYADGSKKLYLDEAHTTAISSADLVELFLIGIAIKTGTGYEVPVNVATTGGYTTVTAGTTDYYSKEKA